MSRNSRPQVRDFRDDYVTCTDFCEVFRRNTTQLLSPRISPDRESSRSTRVFRRGDGQSLRRKERFQRLGRVLEQALLPPPKNSTTTFFLLIRFGAVG